MARTPLAALALLLAGMIPACAFVVPFSLGE
jgi:hypothetical protein